MLAIRDYFQKHRDVFFTIALIAVLDHMFFGGAMKKKLQAAVEQLLETVTKKGGK